MKGGLAPLTVDCLEGTVSTTVRSADVMHRVGSVVPQPAELDTPSKHAMGGEKKFFTNSSLLVSLTHPLRLSLVCCYSDKT